MNEQDSILLTIKKMIGIAEDYTQFDTDIIIHINTAFSRLAQISSGFKKGFRITDSNNLWREYTDDESLLDSIISYVYLKTKIVFDPPTSQMVMESIKQDIKELEFRLQADTE